MLKLDMNSLFNFQLCQHILEDPVVLPCGETVCKSHAKDMCLEKCKLCSETHQVPQNGFLPNKFAKNQLDLRGNRMIQNFTQFNEFKVEVDNLNKKLKEIEAIRQAPGYYIHEYFGELSRQVDLRRETLIDEIHQRSSQLLQQIKNLKAECVGNCKKATETTDSIDAIKTELNDLNSAFDSQEMDDVKFEKIPQRKAKEINELIKPVLNQFKLDLQGKKEYKLKAFEFNLKDLFGSLSCLDFDFDIQKITVNNNNFCITIFIEIY